jgi:hypothetical protein
LAGHIWSRGQESRNDEELDFSDEDEDDEEEYD